MNEEDELLESNIGLNDIVLVETDAEFIRNNLISNFQEYLGETLSDGDERKMFLESFAYILADQTANINETGKSVLLRYSYGNVLDELAVLFGNSRLQAKKSSTTISFTLSQIQSVDVVIPKGTRVTSDGALFFATDEDLIFAANNVETTKTVGATATDVGENYNDIQVGKINKLVDSNEYIQSVSNTTVSAGGSNIESDDDFKERLQMTPFLFSVAGPSNAYKAIAMSVSTDVGDVSVYSPSAGVVEIAVIKQGGEIPLKSDELLNDILVACSDKDKRPLTDNVQVVPATAVEMSIVADYYVESQNITKIPDIVQAVEDYKAWQTEKIGRHINPDMLKNMMLNAGAYRVVITSPEYVELEKSEAVKITSTTVSYKSSGDNVRVEVK